MGNWLDKYQDGGKVTYGTPEYTDAYNKGEVITKEGIHSPILLDEVTVRGKKKSKNWLEQYADKIVEENKDAGPLGAIIGTPLSAITSLPQMLATKLMSGKMQRPSEAIGFENNQGLFESPSSFGKHASNFVLDAVTDPTNLIGAGVLTKEKILAGLARSTEDGILSNAYKLNPNAFKPNPESYYRMIGDEGLADLQNVGYVRSNPNTFYKDKHPFFSKGYPIDGRIGKSVVEDSKYLGNNMIEVGGNNEVGNRFVKNRWADAAPDPNIFVARDKIGIDNPNLKIFEKDWLKGYKQVEAPKSNFKSEIDWAKWNKEIPENRALMQEYNAIDYKNNPLSDKEKEMYKWFDEQMRFDKLPQTTNKQSIEVLDNFKQRIRTPEGQKRLKELGITEEQLLQDLKIVEDPNTYGYYRGAKNTIAMNPNHPLPKKVVRHEIEHGVQNALRQSKINKAVDGTVDDKMKALEINTTEIDDILSGLTLRREGTPNKVWSKLNINEPVNINNYKSLVNNKQNATDYFLTGSEGAEKSAFLGEVQQYMMDIGKIPKDSYTKITPEMVKETMIDAMFDEAGGGKYLRLFNIIKADSKNYEMISKALNKMLSISPLIGAGAYMQNKEYKNGGAIGNNGMFDMTNPNIYKSVLPIGLGLGAASQIEQNKNGGWLSKYN